MTLGNASPGESEGPASGGETIFAMTEVPRPSLLVLVSGVLVALPTVLLLICVFVTLFDLGDDLGAAAMVSGPVWAGMIVFPVPAILLLMTEYRAVYQRDARAAAWVAGVCLWFPVCGSIGWIEGLLRLTGVFPPGTHPWSWADFGAYSAFLGCMAFVGLVHLHWWRVLRALKKVSTVDWDA